MFVKFQPQRAKQAQDITNKDQDTEDAHLNNKNKKSEFRSGSMTPSALNLSTQKVCIVNSSRGADAKPQGVIRRTKNGNAAKIWAKSRLINKIWGNFVTGKWI